MSQLSVALQGTSFPNTATTLYDSATATDQAVIQSPADAGTLAATAH